MPATTAATFTGWDWVVLVGYLALVMLIAASVVRRREGTDDFFLGGRRMPAWAVAVSLVATMQSAATFVGGPQEAFAGDLTYLSTNLAPMLAAIVVAVFFIPAFYRQRVTSVYELIGGAFGTKAQRSASAAFMIGRVFASGARLYIVALPFALITFGDIRPGSMVISILIIAAVAALYTVIGGIRAVIWTDVAQAVVYVGTIAAALWLLWQKFPVGPGELMQAIGGSDAAEKLTVVDTRMAGAADLARPYNLWATLTGLTLFMIAAFGTDQDLTQRLLTCRTRRGGAWSLIAANVLAWPVIFMFLLIGLLLWVYYRRPELVGMEPAAYVVDDSRKVFLTFILQEMPAGVRGLMLAGLFAAAMSSTDSALNAMASTTIADFYRPWRIRREGETLLGRHQEMIVSRVAVAVWAAMLAGFACLCVFWYQVSRESLIEFALGVMVFAYSGLLAVFLTALFMRRGNGLTAILALLAGFVSVLAMQPFLWSRFAPSLGITVNPAFPWKMLMATAISFGICCLGRRGTISSIGVAPVPQG